MGGKRLANLNAWLTTLAALSACGCACVRLPAIDPSGQRIFLPGPAYTTLATNAGPNPCLFGCGCCLPSLCSSLCGVGRGCCLCPGGTPAFVAPPPPPPCGPDGLPPPDAPTFPVGVYDETSAIAPTCGSPAAVTAPPPTCGSPTAAPEDQPLAPVFTETVVINPRRLIAPVGTEVVLLGGVMSPDSNYCPGRYVEWTLAQDSVGAIVDVSGQENSSRRLFGGLLHHNDPSPKRGCADYVATHTLDGGTVLTRGTPDPRDDVYVACGQSWMSLTSGSEGTSYITLAAPDVEDWSRRQQTATIYWVDGQWAFPPPVVGVPFQPQELTTFVVRQSNGLPIPGWIVRYQILDGPAAGLDEVGVQALDVITDSQGHATTRVFPQTAQAGMTRIGVQVIKPASRPSEPTQLLIGEGQTSVTWSDAGVQGAPPDLPPLTPPTGIIEPTPLDQPPPIGETPPFDQAPPIGSEPPIDQPTTTEPVPSDQTIALQVQITGPTTANLATTTLGYRIIVTNVGSAPAEDVLVTDPVPPGLSYLRSEPAGQELTVGGPRRIQWRMESLAPGGSQTFDVYFRAIERGRVNNVVYAQAANAGPVAVSDSFATDVFAPSLRVVVGDPVPDRVEVGQEVNFEIEVTNLGDQPLTDVAVSSRYPVGLEPKLPVGVQPSPRRTVDRSIGELAARDSRRIGITFVAQQPGTFCHDVEVTSAERASDTGRGCVLVSERQIPEMTVQITGPDRLAAGATGDFYVIIRNVGQVTLRDVQVSYESDADLVAEQASQGFDETRLPPVWRYAQLPPGQQAALAVRSRANRNPVNLRPCQRFTVVAQPQIERTSELCVEIQQPQPPPVGEPPPPVGGTGLPPEAPGAALRMTVEPLAESARVNDTLQYVVAIRNDSNISYRDAVLTLNVGEGMEFLPVEGPVRPLGTTNQGRTLQFTTIVEIRAGETLEFRAPIRVTQPGEATLGAELASRGLAQPLTAQDSVSVYP